MAYENIVFTKPNMTMVDGYFYMMDESNDVLVEKIDDGLISNTYPLDTVLTNTVNQLHYDGANFWTLQDYTPGGITIRRWRLENNRTTTVLKDTFNYADDAYNTYDADAFAVEHYITGFSTSVSGGDTVISINKYYDTTVSSGITLTLGPNSSDETEDATVSGISGSNITLSSGIQYDYETGDQVSFYKSFFVFNNYAGVDTSSGTLFRFDGYDGSYIASDADGEYKNITASIFTRLTGVFFSYPDVDTLIYVKDTNAKMRNVSDLLSTQAASTANDDFTGADNDPPNTTRWNTVVGNSKIFDNRLRFFTGNDRIESNYYLLGDFDVQISGSIDGYDTVTSGSYDHFMRFIFPKNSSDWCEIGRRGLNGAYVNTTYTAQGVLGWEVTIDTTYLGKGLYLANWGAYDKDGGANPADEVTLRLQKDATIIDVYGLGTGNNVWVDDSNEVVIPEAGVWTIKGRQHVSASFVWGIRYPSLVPVASGSLSFEYSKGSTNDITTMVSGAGDDYLFRVTRVDDNIKFYYKTVVSGAWTDGGNVDMHASDCILNLGVESVVTVSGAYFDDLIYNSGNIRYPPDSISYYGVALMDNIRINQSTVIPVYDLSATNRTLYRLQDEATYYGTDNQDWGTKYNYQITPLRSFVDSITVTAYPDILPSNGINISDITGSVLDQYGNGVIYKPVFWTEDDDYGYITNTTTYTDLFFGTGSTTTFYTAGIQNRAVTITGRTTQYD
ncbi:MAG: hypothetical protein ACXACY_24620 [Candidatus Hodarchaeales archaeon]|jgi:hypothetical protein